MLGVPSKLMAAEGDVNCSETCLQCAEYRGQMVICTSRAEYLEHAHKTSTHVNNPHFTHEFCLSSLVLPGILE